MGIRRKKLEQGSEWAEWLRDDPVPSRTVAAQKQAEPVVHRARVANDTRARLRTAGVGGVAAQSQQKENAGPTVSIHISLPKVTVPKVKLPSRKQTSYWGTFMVVVLVLSIGTRGALSVLGSAIGKHQPSKGDVKGTSTSSQPTFTPAVPSDKKDLATSNGTTSRYVASKQLYTYSDTLLDDHITVSEQPLPTDMKQNPALIPQMAASIGAKTKFDTAFGTAYVATSENHSSQRLMFVRKDLLIFIESTKTHDNDAWKLYIENLR